MKKIKILSLYSEAFDLNGDFRNAEAFAKRIEEMGYEAELVLCGIGEDFDPLDCDIIFMGNGKPHNVSAACGHFLEHGEKLLAAAEGGKPFVVTGSANMLLGKTLRFLDGTELEGIGLLNCESTEFDGLYVSTAVLEPDFAPEKRVFGAYYRYAEQRFNTPNEHPLFTVLKADKNGAGALSETEGYHYKNVFATWCLGPVLIRNPLMMRKVLMDTLGEDYRETDFSLEEKAAELLLQEPFGNP